MHHFVIKEMDFAFDNVTKKLFEDNLRLNFGLFESDFSKRNKDALNSLIFFIK